MHVCFEISIPTWIKCIYHASRNLNGNIKYNDMTIVWSRYKGDKEVVCNLD
jgi:hypothetical protein